MSRTLLARTPSEVEGLREVWERLCCPSRHTLFQSFAWNLLAARAFAAREAPYVIAVESGNGVAILPTCVTHLGVSFLGDALFDYRDMLTAGDEEDMTTAWREVARLGRPLHVTALAGRRADDRWRAMGLPTSSFVSAPCVLRSDLDAAAFEACHPRGARLLRRLFRMGITFHEHSGTEAALVRTIYERKAEQAVEYGENLFTDPVRRNFLVAAAARGGCDVFTFESAGTLVAALVTFRDGNARRFYTTYFDHAWAHFSPGIALLFEVTRRSLAAGLDCDYMTGEQPHKMRFATSSMPLYQVDASAELLAKVASDERLAAA